MVHRLFSTESKQVRVCELKMTAAEIDFAKLGPQLEQQEIEVFGWSVSLN